MTLTDEATYYEAVLTDHHAAGKALAFRSWNMVSELFRKARMDSVLTMHRPIHRMRQRIQTSMHYMK